MTIENGKVDFYCQRCRKSLHLTYGLTGKMDSPVMPNITMKCPHCTRALEFKDIKERHLLGCRKSNKYYI
ncbi:hypothetical protein SAMN05216390_11731 [Lachnospiraceae bacterium KH1T2]|nr:hypothetical protein SAMN05216390_11731 [Lachnospiraceae bacterium KH1T2]